MKAQVTLQYIHVLKYLFNFFPGLGLGSDYNMELVIALEMSRLQMIEDRMKQAQANSITPDPSSSISSNSADGTDDQLKLAIQLSLQESTAALSRQMQLEKSATDDDEDYSNTRNYQRTNADITVDYFLKSLANHKIDLKNIEVGMNVFKNDGDSEWCKADKDYFFKPCNGNEDGRFQISDIHESGYKFANVDDYDEEDVRLKRSHSTGDLCIRRSGRGARTRPHGDEPRYHLDSDHSSQHDDKPEDITRRVFALPSTSGKTKQFLLLHHMYPEENSAYQGQSSIEDTTTSDSLNADMEVCGILGSVTDEDLYSRSYEDEEYKEKAVLEKPTCKQQIKTEDISKIEETTTKKHSPFASLKAKLCSAHLPKSSYLTRIAVNKSIGLLSEAKNKNEEAKVEGTRRNSDHAVTFKKELAATKSESPKSLKHTKNKKTCSSTGSFSKSTSFLLDSGRQKASTNGKAVSTNLRIQICRSPIPKHSSSKSSHPLETDSSNEYESETGIPKSPTLFISGVSISRTPEPKSPGISLISGRQSRSSSLSVPVPLSSVSLSISTTSLNNSIATPAEPFTPSLIRSTTPATSKSNVQHGTGSNNSSPARHVQKENPKSKSASEPEREREMFRFPKSSTDGALSSVLHVQESNLSSDDFHEALFLLERSPKTRDSKRRKKSKKKDKDERKEEVSSAL